MKRFKNILVVYDLSPGSDETLQRAIDLAGRNAAKLRLLCVIDPAAQGWEMFGERERMIQRIADSIPLPEHSKSMSVRLGPPAEQILDEAKTIRAELIITSDTSSGYYTQVLGLDATTEVMRHALCPVWVVRPASDSGYHRIVAAVNAGRVDALTCPANRRILELSRSLAELENAELHVVYAWDYNGSEKDMMGSEQPPGQFEEYSEMARLRNLDKLIILVRNVLGDPLNCTPVAVQGEPGTVVIDYAKTSGADLLVTDGKLGGPIISALVETHATQLLRKSSCSVLFARPHVYEVVQGTSAAA
ncbi:universal stress protein [Magnetospira sp. QH-2]|uniref:universal stress protein n=1 Tax=Magnetospira sp. (strain QH-2) TaxID=1288970 RepID=UPI0003E81B25|nr:universal stress protein [Magnetospira sp. QH-2]CCQ72207.1 putative universal stress protein [Magnetospira sp. QH-2]